MPSGSLVPFPARVILSPVRWYLRYGFSLPRPRGAAPRARERRRPRHPLSMGSATRVLVDRRDAPPLVNVIEDLVSAALHNTGQYQNNRVECDHGRLKARLRPTHGLKPDRSERGYPGATPSSRTGGVAATRSRSTLTRCSGRLPQLTNQDRESDQHRRQGPASAWLAIEHHNRASQPQGRRHCPHKSVLAQDEELGRTA